MKEKIDNHQIINKLKVTLENSFYVKKKSFLECI